MVAKCGICNEADGRYKCPQCRTAYCSVTCFKSHKGSAACAEAREALLRQREAAAANGGTLDGRRVINRRDEPRHRLARHRRARHAIGTVRLHAHVECRAVCGELRAGADRQGSHTRAQTLLAAATHKMTSARITAAASRVLVCSHAW